MKDQTIHKPYVIVINAGADDEQVIEEHQSYIKAYLRRNHQHPTGDVMKRLDDGTLTTEY